MRRPWLRTNKSFAEGANELSVLVEFRDRLRPAAQHEEMAVGIECHAADAPVFTPSGTGSGLATAT